MSHNSQSDTLEHLASLAEQLREAGDATLAMLTGEVPADPLVLLAMASAAVIVRHERAALTPGEPALALADRLIGALQRTSGRKTLHTMIAQIDLGAAIDLEPDMDPAEQVSRLHDLFELGMLVELVDRETRTAITEVLDRNATLLLFESEAFAALYVSASQLLNVVDIPDDHPVAAFLDTVVAATDALAEVPDNADLIAGFAVARDKAEARLPAWVGWREHLAGLGDAVGDFIQKCARPLAAFAATEVVTWPAPRLVLAQRGDRDEVGLLAVPSQLLLEWVGEGAPDEAVLTPTNIVLESVRGPLPSGRYWRLPAPGSAEHIALRGAGQSWSVGLTPTSSTPVDLRVPSSLRLDWWLAVAPGALAKHLVAQAEHVRPTNRAWAMAFEEEAGRVSVPRLASSIGRAWFPVVVEDPDIEGALVTVDSGKLFGREESEASPRVRRWIGRLVDLVDHPALASIAVQVMPVAGLQFQGDSYELASAVAALSRLLQVAPTQAPVLSGRLGEGRAEVLPIAAVETKRRVAALEAPSVYTRIVEAPADASPWLEELFGSDWSARLRAALGIEAAVHAREAVRAWQSFFSDRTVLRIATERERALSEAELALAAGAAGPDRVQALWVRGAMFLHRGETARARADLDEARRALAAASAHEHERWALEECDAYLGIAFVDLCRPSDAVPLLNADLVRLDAVGSDHRDRRWHEVRLQVAGTLARALGATGDLDQAVAVARASLDSSHVRAQRSRSLMDLAELERRSGALDVARATLIEARAELDAIADDHSRNFTERFLRLYEVRAGMTGSDYAVEAPVWEHWPQPAEILESLLSAGESEITDWFRSHIRADLDTLSTVWLIVLLGALSRVPNRTSATEASLGELATTLLERPDIDQPTRGAAQLVLDDVEAGARAWARRAPY